MVCHVSFFDDVTLKKNADMDATYQLFPFIFFILTPFLLGSDAKPKLSISSMQCNNIVQNKRSTCTSNFVR